MWWCFLFYYRVILEMQESCALKYLEHQKTEIIFLNDTNSFKKTNEIKIENFRILGDLLSKSYYGKII